MQAAKTKERRVDKPPNSKPGRGNVLRSKSLSFAGRCWNCDKTGHVASECTTPKAGSTGSDNLLPPQYLLPDSDRDVQVSQVWVRDKGSNPQTVRVVIAGVPVDGTVDTGADITIMGAEVFKRLAAVVKLRRHDFKPADRTPHTYN